MGKENDYEEWQELRGRVDSVSNAVFLIAGGALSLSITVMLDLKGKNLLHPGVAALIEDAWWFLLSSIILMLLNKVLAVLQAYLLHVHTEYHDRVYMKYNFAGWVLGTIGLSSFAWALALMVRAASVAVLT